jgi:hypothetical protein
MLGGLLRGFTTTGGLNAAGGNAGGSAACNGHSVSALLTQLG